MPYAQALLYSRLAWFWPIQQRFRPNSKEGKRTRSDLDVGAKRESYRGIQSELKRRTEQDEDRNVERLDERKTCAGVYL